VWRAGEHVALIGDTGSGKTYLEARLLQLRPYVLVLRTKPDDNQFPGFKRIRSVAQIDIAADRYVLEPAYDKQYRECVLALERVWRQGSWCVALDELFYLEDTLRIKRPIARLLTQGRSKRITVVAGMQRPALRTRFAISQATHVFCFATEGRDIKTLQAATTPRMELVANLRRFEFAYFNRRTRAVTLGTAQDLGAVLGGSHAAAHPYGHSLAGGDDRRGADVRPRDALGGRVSGG
jgi:ABC-type dipeptide/oligopeptide/nickel transport system ATPase component